MKIQYNPKAPPHLMGVKKEKETSPTPEQLMNGNRVAMEPKGQRERDNSDNNNMEAGNGGGGLESNLFRTHTDT